jgi:hypothetical protein
MTEITTPCLLCATEAVHKGSAFFASRGVDWPLTEVAGRAVHKACASTAEHAVLSAADGSLMVGPDGIGRWNTSGRAIPADAAAVIEAFAPATGMDLAATERAHQAEQAAALAAYRANPPQPDAEQLAGMRNAFGPGTEVVNVITGQRTIG